MTAMFHHVSSSTKVMTGAERLLQGEYDHYLEKPFAYLGHSASITSDYQWVPTLLQKKVGSKLCKLFGPQHGLFSNVQDNMVETEDFIHPFYKIPVYSLYSHTRSPTNQMLDGIQTVLVDLQDVGTRVYTYFSTLTLLMEACAERKIKVVILDRPNPIGGEILEGHLLDRVWSSFVGRYPLPQRHGMTMGELALWACRFVPIACDVEVVPMKHWKRSMSYPETQCPWVWPSPNLPTWEGAYTFVGTVLFEGTNISEGRGTTRSLEMIGHPAFHPFEELENVSQLCLQAGLEGFVLRPMVFVPTFQKHQQKSTGGFHIHVTNTQTFRPWMLGQLLCRYFYQRLGKDFAWKQPPYEYEHTRMPIDLINGSEDMRRWVESKQSWSQAIADLKVWNEKGHEDFQQQRKTVLLYS
jgi:uncharacterized protein YbbC (DUF1343 family)